MSENTIRIAVDRDTVYGVLADGWKYTNWVVGTSHMRAVSPSWPAPGSKLHHSVGAWPLMVEDETEVQSVEPGRSVVLLAHGRPLGSALVEIDLADDGDGCRVTMREKPVRGPGKWLPSPVTDALLHRRNTETLERLAALCERRTEPAD